MGAQNGRQQPVLWHRGAPVKTQAGDVITDQTTGPPSVQPDISVVFLVAYTGKLKRLHLHRCSAVTRVISAGHQKHLSPLPLTI